MIRTAAKFSAGGALLGAAVCCAWIAMPNSKQLLVQIGQMLGTCGQLYNGLGSGWAGYDAPVCFDAKLLVAGVGVFSGGVAGFWAGFLIALTRAPRSAKPRLG